jgi:hypothetical protein
MVIIIKRIGAHLRVEPSCLIRQDATGRDLPVSGGLLLHICIKSDFALNAGECLVLYPYTHFKNLHILDLGELNILSEIWVIILSISFWIGRQGILTVRSPRCDWPEPSSVLQKKESAPRLSAISIRVLFRYGQILLIGFSSWWFFLSNV